MINQNSMNIYNHDRKVISNQQSLSDIMNHHESSWIIIIIIIIFLYTTPSNSRTRKLCAVDLTHKHDKG